MRILDICKCCEFLIASQPIFASRTVDSIDIYKIYRVFQLKKTTFSDADVCWSVSTKIPRIVCVGDLMSKIVIPEKTKIFQYSNSPKKKTKTIINLNLFNHIEFISVRIPFLYHRTPSLNVVVYFFFIFVSRRFQSTAASYCFLLYITRHTFRITQTKIAWI